jgi:hypothetical protein
MELNVTDLVHLELLTQDTFAQDKRLVLHQKSVT